MRSAQSQTFPRRQASSLNQIPSSSCAPAGKNNVNSGRLFSVVLSSRARSSSCSSSSVFLRFSSGRRYYDSVVSLLQGWLVYVHRNRRLIRDGSPAGTATSTFTQLLSSACCRVAVVCRFSDIRDKMRPMPKHGSIQLYVHGNPKAGQDGQPRTATSTLTDTAPDLCLLQGMDRLRMWVSLAAPGDRRY